MTAIGLVLGAGAASRFGATKQVANFAGRPLISFPIQALRGAGLEQVLIVLGANSEHVVPHLRGEEVVFNPEWRDGLSTSLRAGLEAAAARGADRVVVALADQPLLSSQAVARVLEASNRGAQIARATYFGNAGHPIALAQDTFGAVARLRGDAGARALRDFAIVDVPCDGLGSPADIDTPDDVARLAPSRSMIEVHASARGQESRS